MSADLPRPPRQGQDPPAARHLRLVSDSPKPRAKRHRKPPHFSPEESSRIRAALRHARILFGGWDACAAAMYLGPERVIATATGRRSVSASLALRLSRALGVPLESLYRAPTDAGRCAACGRST